MILTAGTNIKKKTQIEMYITVFLFAISIGLNFVGIKLYGLYGAVFVQIILNFIGIIIIMFYNSRYFKLKIEFGKIFYLVLLFFALIIVKYLFVRFSIFQNGLISGFLIPSLLLIFFLLVNYKYLFFLKDKITSLIVKR